MSHEAAELELYIFNTEKYYPTLRMIVANLAAKRYKGTYNRQLAPKAFDSVIQRAAKDYAREFARPGDERMIFTPQVRREVAKFMADRRYMIAIESGAELFRLNPHSRARAWILRGTLF